MVFMNLAVILEGGHNFVQKYHVQVKRKKAFF